jgi:hypothetical protein
MRIWLSICVAPWLLAIGGCQVLTPAATMQSHSPLRPARPSPGSVTIETMWVRFPAGDPQLNEAAWREIDETKIEPAVRRELANNGLRAGVISGTLPEAMARALDQGATEEESDSPAATGEAEGGPILAAEPQVRGRRRQLRRLERFEIQASDIYPTMPLLESDGRELSGRTYSDAQAMYVLRVEPQPDRTVIAELTPELHYGPQRLRFKSAEEGILRQEPMRDREVFDRMRMTVRLSAGEMLVLLNLPEAGSRLGHYFHTSSAAAGPEQKLILVRLAEMPPSDTFATAN